MMAREDMLESGLESNGNKKMKYKKIIDGTEKKQIIFDEFINELKEKIEDAEENCGNLDWISKDQAIKIINETKLRYPVCGTKSKKKKVF